MSEVHLKYLIDNTPASICSSVPTGDFRWTYVSANALDVLGYTPERIVADTNFWFDHIHPEDLEQIFFSLAMIFVEGQQTYE